MTGHLRSAAEPQLSPFPHGSHQTPVSSALTAHLHEPSLCSDVNGSSPALRGA